MHQQLSELIMLADILDAGGFEKEASSIDSIIQSLAASQPRSVQDFIDDLKIGFTNAAKSKTQFPNITEESLPEILRVVDILSQHQSYMPPDIPQERLEEISDYSRDLVDQVFALRDNVLAVERNLKIETDAEERRKLESEMRQYNVDLQNLGKELNQLKEGRRVGDREKYERFLKLYNERVNK